MMSECFVIMPISDQPGYKPGHFKVVYDEIIVPACKILNLKAVLANNGKGSDIIIFDILKKLIESPVAICDLSAKNPNVMFELGIRQAFDLPVVLLKDEITGKIFDIESIRYCRYDSRLWPELIRKSIQDLAEHLRYTMSNQSEFTLVKMLGSKAAEIKNSKVSPETMLLLNAIENSHIGRQPVSNGYISEVEIRFENNIYCVGESMTTEDFHKLKIGNLIHLGKYGFGEIIELNKKNKNDFSFAARLLYREIIIPFVFLPHLFNNAILMK